MPVLLTYKYEDLVYEKSVPCSFTNDIKMKAAILLFAFVGCLLYPDCKADLQDDLDKILSLIPEEEIKAVVQNYINRGDSEVLELLKYRSSDEYKLMMSKIRAVPGVQDGISRLEKRGVDVDNLFERLFTLFGLPPVEIVYSKNSRTQHPQRNGLENMFEEIRAVIPMNKIIGVFLETLIESEDLQAVFEYLQEPETYQTVLEVLEIEEVKLAIVWVKNHGVDVDTIANQIKTIFGWS